MNNSSYNNSTSRSGASSYRSSDYRTSGQREESLLQETDRELHDVIRSATDRDRGGAAGAGDQSLFLRGKPVRRGTGTDCRRFDRRRQKRLYSKGLRAYCCDNHPLRSLVAFYGQFRIFRIKKIIQGFGAAPAGYCVL